MAELVEVLGIVLVVIVAYALGWLRGWHRGRSRMTAAIIPEIEAISRALSEKMGV